MALRRRGVRKAKRHDRKLIQSITSAEGCLANVLLTDTNLVVPHLQIKLGKHLCSMQLLKQVIDVGQRVLVFYGLLVDASVVLDQPASTIVLLHKKARGTPRGSARTNESILLKLHKLLVQLNQLLRAHL